jgi:hypothetical protein
MAVTKYRDAGGPQVAPRLNLTQSQINLFVPVPHMITNYKHLHTGRCNQQCIYRAVVNGIIINLWIWPDLGAADSYEKATAPSEGKKAIRHA